MNVDPFAGFPTVEPDAPPAARPAKGAAPKAAAPRSAAVPRKAARPERAWGPFYAVGGTLAGLAAGLVLFPSVARAGGVPAGPLAGAVLGAGMGLLLGVLLWAIEARVGPADLAQRHATSRTRSVLVGAVTGGLVASMMLQRLGMAVAGVPPEAQAEAVLIVGFALGVAAGAPVGWAFWHAERPRRAPAARRTRGERAARKTSAWTRAKETLRRFSRA